jgi:50S ribosomal subunit-associated GTPase HflX
MFAKRRANVHNLGFCTFYRSGEPQTLCIGQGKCSEIHEFAKPQNAEK